LGGVGGAEFDERKCSGCERESERGKSVVSARLRAGVRGVCLCVRLRDACVQCGVCVRVNELLGGRERGERAKEIEREAGQKESVCRAWASGYHLGQEMDSAIAHSRPPSPSVCGDHPAA
jgi:hypothetical protein